MRTALRRMIESDPALRVVDTACDGVEGLEKTIRLHPDVVTMDVEMPRMTGLEALSKIMELAPCPVIMVSSLTQAHAEATIEALSRGAYDFLSKDLSYASIDIVRIKNDLISKCKAAAARRRIRQRPVPLAPPTRVVTRAVRNFAPPRIICIGTSTGGPKALQQILPMLPAGIPAPIVIVQHMPPGFTAPFARRLDSLCSNRVKESEPNEPLLPGVIYIARAGQQLRVVRRGSGATAHMSLMPANTPHIPSVDILLLSAAGQFAQRTMGVILTGMGNDGQQGMTAIHQAGGYTLGEDERSCTVYGMPRACAEAGILHNVLPLDAIPGEITRVLGVNSAQLANEVVSTA
jgi:two-component system chemotaxis response regulator CheB